MPFFKFINSSACLVGKNCSEDQTPFYVTDLPNGKKFQMNVFDCCKNAKRYILKTLLTNCGIRLPKIHMPESINT